MTSNIVLVGDSIFDNGAYVPGEPSVTEQLRAIVQSDVDVSMLAVDGDCVPDVEGQVRNLGAQATHIFVSAGGNDALLHAHKLENDYLTSEELFAEWSAIQAGFRTDYRNMLKAVLGLGCSTAVCTVYDAVPSIDAISITALSLFNDVIVGEAVSAGIPIVDLRWVCTEETDYSTISPIEPSCRGGQKIATTLNRLYQEHDFSSKRTVIYT